MDAHSLLTLLTSPPFPLILLLIFMKRGNNLQSFPDLLSLSTSSSSLLTAALRVSGIAPRVRAKDLNMKKGEAGQGREEMVEGWRKRRREGIVERGQRDRNKGQKVKRQARNSKEKGCCFKACCHCRGIASVPERRAVSPLGFDKIDAQGSICICYSGHGCTISLSFFYCF